MAGKLPTSTAAEPDARIAADPPHPEVSRALRDAVASGTIDPAVRLIVKYLRGQDYAVGDLFRDLRAVKLELTQIDPKLSDWLLLDDLAARCLEYTSAVHEAAIESMMHGFCEIDPGGNIGYANWSMLDLLPDCEGHDFADLFGMGQEAVREGLHNELGSQILQLPLLTRHGARPVLLEVGRTRGSRTSFAILTDLSSAQKAERRVIERMPVPVLKLDAEHYVTLANREAEILLERTQSEIVGVNVLDFFSDDDSNRALLVTETLKRLTGEGSQYDLKYKPPRGRHVRNLRVLAMPDFGLVDDKVVGTLAMLRSMDEEIAARDVFGIVASESDPQRLFERIMERIHPLVPFTSAFLSVYSADRAFVQMVASYPLTLGSSHTRWFPVPEAMRKLADSDCPFAVDFGTYLDDTAGGAEVRANPGVMQLLKDGMKAFLLLPIFEGATLLAGLTLMSNEVGIYDKKTMLRLEELGTVQGLQTVLSLLEAKQVSFAKNLLKHMAPVTDSTALAHLVCEHLAQFYGWQNVSIFKVNALQEQLELIAQAVPPDGLVLPEYHTQPLAIGLLGRSFAKEDVVKLAALEDGSEEARAYHVGNAETQSEVCVPIRLEKRIVWILNVEDRRRYAFEGPDEGVLRDVVNMLEASINRTFQNELLKQVLDVVPDGVVLVDPAGVVVRCNAKARKMLGVIPEGLRLAERVRDHRAAEALNFPVSDPCETGLLNDKGEMTNVRLRTATTREEYSYRVVILEDVAKRMVEREHASVNSAVADVASKARVPISLVSSFLRQIERKSQDILLPAINDKVNSVAAMARKAAEQLDRVDLTYEQVMLAMAEPEPITGEPRSTTVDLVPLLDSAIAELPGTLRDRFRVSIAKPTRKAKADLNSARFLIESMLACALEESNGEASIDVRLVADDGKLTLDLDLPAEHHAGGSDEESQTVRTSRRPLSTVEQSLPRVASRLEGGFERRGSAHHDTLRLWLPAEVDHV